MIEISDPKGLLKQKTMSLDTPVGAKVKFSYPENGRSMDVTRASWWLKRDAVYEVAHIHVGSWCTEVELLEVPEVWFNSVQFENVE